MKMKNRKELCRDDIAGAYFYTTESRIELAILAMYSLIEEYGFASANKWVNLLGLKDIRNGNEVGWNETNALFDVVYSRETLPNGKKCLLISHKNYPPSENYICHSRK